MRNPVAAVIVASLALVAFSAAVTAQDQGAAPRPRRQVQPGYVAEGVPKMPNPPGPAPKQDLTGAWVGPQNVSRDPMPAMTPAGEARFKQSKPYVQGGVREGDVKTFASNDPFIVCDPLGFPRDLLNHAVSSRGGMIFQPGQNRMFIMFEQQRVWREIWMDGRQLPSNVDAKGAPDSRYYGYSVGHWEDDNTFVVDTTGLDDKTWLSGAGYPHTMEAHVQERYTRPDHNDLQVTVTVEDPKLYTKPFVLGRAGFRWLPSQELEEQLCIPSEMLQYLQLIGEPGGQGLPPAK